MKGKVPVSVKLGREVLSNGNGHAHFEVNVTCVRVG
jgi:hypothetical protein